MSAPGQPLRAPVPRLPTDSIPLTFSQQWTWDALELGKNGSSRSIVAAVRLLGDLSIESLRRSVQTLIARHEALRTTIVSIDGVPEQRVAAAPQAYDLDIIGLTGVPSSERDAEAKRLAEELVNEPLDVAVGPLFATRLLELEGDDHVLVIGMDHIISDGFSIGILLRELWTLYAQFLRGDCASLPDVRVQFGDYAVWQRRTHAGWCARHWAYWQERLADARHLDLFPGSRAPTGPVRIGWQTLSIDRTVCAGLGELCRRCGTTLVMGTLTSYIALLLRWSRQTDVVMAFVSLGRFHPAVKNTIGYFGATMFLRAQLHETDTFLDLLGRVTAEYTAAYEHADSGYVASQHPTPRYLSNPRFNWYPREFQVSPSGYLEETARDGRGQSIRQARFEITPRTDYDARRGGPELMLAETDGEIAGRFWYRTDLIPLTAAECFTQSFVKLVQTLVEAPLLRIASVPMPPAPLALGPALCRGSG